VPPKDITTVLQETMLIILCYAKDLMQRASIGPSMTERQQKLFAIVVRNTCSARA